MDMFFGGFLSGLVAGAGIVLWSVRHSLKERE